MYYCYIRMIEQVDRILRDFVDRNRLAFSNMSLHNPSPISAFHDEHSVSVHCSSEIQSTTGLLIRFYDNLFFFSFKPTLIFVVVLRVAKSCHDVSIFRAHTVYNQSEYEKKEEK